jgi:hypothetical protein
LRQQLQRPPRTALRRGAAGQRGQPGLLRPVQLAVLAARRLAARQRGVQPLLDEVLPHPVDGREAGVERAHDLPVLPARPRLALVRLQQDPRPRRRARRVAALGQHLFQLMAF